MVLLVSAGGMPLRKPRPSRIGISYIAKDEVIIFPTNHPQGLSTVRGSFNSIAMLSEHDLQHVAKIFLIIDNQYGFVGHAFDHVLLHALRDRQPDC